MELKVVILTLLAAALVLLSAFAGYYYAYKRHINRALAEPYERRLRLAPPRTVLIVFAAVFVLLCLTLIVAGLRGQGRLSTLSDVEADVGLSQGWEMESAMNGRAAAVLCFDAERGEHSFYVYENVGGEAGDYVFRYGGSSTSIERCVRAFSFGGTTALISMNSLHIAAIDSHGGARYEIDPDRPFVLLIPGGGFDAYDSAGQLLNLEQEQWYEATDAEK